MDTGPGVVHLLGQLHGHAPHQIDQGGEALGIGGREVGELNPEQRTGGRRSSASPPTDAASRRAWRSPSESSTDTEGGSEMKVSVRAPSSMRTAR